MSQAGLDALFEPFNRSDAPGMVVGVARHGELLYRRAFGLASIEHGVANTPRTRMRIGSTSKHFACVAALLLAEEGLLDIDAGIRRYLPELPDIGHEPTLRQLMQHTGGARDSLDLGFIASGMTIKPRGASLASQVRQREVNFAPGERVIYNNGGYHMLSHAIARVAGMPFEAVLEQRLFTPLGMVDTVSVPSDFTLVPGIAALHVAQPDGGWRRGVFPSEEVLGEGGIVSTVDDMLRWLAHLRSPRIGSAASWEQMLAPARLNNGSATTYALGLMIDDYRGLRVVHHGGTVIGGNCQMLTVPAHGLDVILIANGVRASLFDLANSVIETLLGEEVFSAPPPLPALAERHAALPGASYAALDGSMVLAFAEVQGKLGLAVHNAPPVPLREEEGGALCLDFNRVATGPYRIEPGAADTLRFTDAGATTLLTRLPAPPPLAECGPRLLGPYRAHDLGADAVIAFEGEALLLWIAGEYGPTVLRLTPLAAGLFGWKFEGALAPLGGTLRVEPGGDLRLNTLRTRHLRFERIKE